MPKINRNGVNIFYETHGEGPVVLLTHGFSATSKMWHDQIDFLSSDYCLVLWDMRGHGSSDYPEDINLYNENIALKNENASF